MEPITDDLTDEMIVARFDLDVVRHAESIDWCSAVCLDGPMAGKTVYAVNRIGSRVTAHPSPGPAGAAIEYEVVKMASGQSPAELRVVGSASQTD
jgi:hypothetical protein